MQGTVVVLVALSGWGCQNKDCPVCYAPPMGATHGDAHLDFHSVAPPGYRAYSPSPDSGCDTWGYPGGALRATLWSFVLGRDPDVATAREVEGSFDSGGYAPYEQLDSIPSARRPPESESVP